MERVALAILRSVPALGQVRLQVARALLVSEQSVVDRPDDGPVLDGRRLGAVAAEPAALDANDVFSRLLARFQRALRHRNRRWRAGEGGGRRSRGTCGPSQPGQQHQERPTTQGCHAMELRHMRAAELFERGVIPAEIARQVGVAHQVVSEWRKAWRQGGCEALRSAGPAGRKSKLTDAQFTEIRNALINGVGANGYSTDAWTAPRVAEVIERLTGVSYHPGHVCYLLHDQLDWTWQRPA
jgi:transposase